MNGTSPTTKQVLDAYTLARERYAALEAEAVARMRARYAEGRKA